MIYSFQSLVVTSVSQEILEDEVAAVFALLFLIVFLKPSSEKAWHLGVPSDSRPIESCSGLPTAIQLILKLFTYHWTLDC